MDNGIYITLSRQAALFRDMDVTANNIANMNTTSYNANRVMFESYLTQDGRRGGMDFAHDVAEYRDTQPGTMRVTGNPFDLAIEGDGYFVVETPLGTRYTRAGNFQLDAEGTLVTPEGYAVLDQNNARIVFTQDDRDIVVGSAGNIGVNDGEERATINVVQFANPQLLERRGERMFATEADPLPAEGMRVAQGVLENSNVQAVAEVTHMLKVSRAVGNTAKFIETMYDLQRRSTQIWTQQG